MVGVAQWLERRPVEPQVAGSNPVAHPNVLTFPYNSSGITTKNLEKPKTLLKFDKNI
jgi:hypothetical protein